MSALKKITRLIVLLSAQRRVPREQIMEELGVKERTVYRYINRLSEANIPVYYDSELGGYRLNRGNQWSGLLFGETEAMTTIIALLYSCRRLPKPYCDTVREAANRLCSLRGLPAEDAEALVEAASPDEDSDPSFGRAITNGLILYAIAAGQGIQVEFEADDDREPVRRTLHLPGLRFEKSWCLFDQYVDEDWRAPLSSVRSVMLVHR